MAIPNVETTASRADYDVRTHKSNSKPHNAQAKPEQPSGGNPPKEDTVTISEEGKGLFELRKLSEEEKEFTFLKFKEHDWDKQKAMLQESFDSIREEKRAEFEDSLIHYGEYSYEYYVYSALEGKVENANKLAGQLGSMFFGDRNESAETRAMNREEGKMLAEYISQNYFENPDEAKAFMDTIDKWAFKSEMRDKGYMVMNSVHSDMIWKEQPDYFKTWASENGYGDDIRNESEDNQSTARKAYLNAQIEHWYKNRESYKEGFSIDNGGSSFIYGTEEYELVHRAYLNMQDYYDKNPIPYREWTITEYAHSIDPGSKTSGESINMAGHRPVPGMHEEYYKSWLEQFRSNEKAVQSVIDNAKLAIKGVSIEDLLAKHGSYI